MPLTPLPPPALDAIIDVSHHNGAIDWPAVAAAGIALVFIKATQGTGFIDPRFESNRAEAAKAGLMVVPYHFLDDQARHFIDVTGLAAGQPAMIDWESAAPPEMVVTFSETLIDCTSRDPVGYYGFAQLHAADDTLSRWRLMLPEYPRGNRPGDYASLVKRPPRLPPGRSTAWDAPTRPYDFHQYTPAGHVRGVATPVDRSIWVGDAASLRAWYAAV
jgi:lysozyme